ncbi:MAG: 4Fe-4S binding protein [Deltaproteobacteria bacterium]|nr:MAG: 4Fe-4S binding protein [Deltaproteobacteria bacterium]
MSTEIYRKLAHHLDNLPGGFPSTDSGVELRILRRLFTPEEATLALHLTLFPEESEVIAGRAEIAPDETARLLEQMARKGLIYSIQRGGGEPRYMANQYIIGIWEFSVNNLDPDLIRDMNEYAPTLFNEAWKVPQLRTIPVGRSLTPQHTTLPYEQAEALVRAQDRFVVAPCICRREHTMVDKGCDRPEETCLVFGTAADYYVRNGLGRVIDLEETLQILNTAEEAGFVLQPSNAKKAVNICLCCGCCCQVLKNIKRHPQPASLVSSPFVAAVDLDTCAGCGTCIDRCQMEALELEDDTVALDVDRCIGCGLCVPTCSTESIVLVRKPESEQPDVPQSMVEAAIKLGRARGKL